MKHRHYKQESLLQSKRLLYKQNQGFTLLELVLVLFILAILTTTGLSFLENEDGQLRYNQSLTKRDAIVDAIYQESLEGSQRILSGFVVDNGQLPSVANTDSGVQRTAHLLSNVDSWFAYGSQTIQIHTDTVTGEVASADGLNLFKGFSNSNYLRSDNAGGFKDAWGQEFFISDIASNALTIGYDGDGQLDFDNDATTDETQTIAPKPEPFGTDEDLSIAENDWSVDINQIDIIINNDSCPATELAPCDYEVAIVVFRNNSTCGVTIGDCWDTYHFATGNLNDGDVFTTSGTPPTWDQNDSGAVINSRIPAGEHYALVLEDEGDAAVLTATRFKVLPNSTQPTVSLTIP